MALQNENNTNGTIQYWVAQMFLGIKRGDTIKPIMINITSVNPKTYKVLSHLT